MKIFTINITVYASFLLAFCIQPLYAESGHLQGEANIGASITSGNTQTAHIDAEISGKFVSSKFQDNYFLKGQLSKENGKTTAKHFQGSVESLYNLKQNLVIFGYVQYDNDKFSGFSYEINSAFGFGLKVLDTQNKKLLVQLGPGYRYSKLSNPQTKNDNIVLLRGSTNMEYRLSKHVYFSQINSITYDKVRLKLESTSSITNQLIGNVSTRLSFSIKHITKPPALTKKTDTYTKASIVYTF